MDRNETWAGLARKLKWTISHRHWTRVYHRLQWTINGSGPSRMDHEMRTIDQSRPYTGVHRELYCGQDWTTVNQSGPNGPK